MKPTVGKILVDGVQFDGSNLALIANKYDLRTTQERRPGGEITVNGIKLVEGEYVIRNNRGISVVSERFFIDNYTLGKADYSFEKEVTIKPTVGRIVYYKSFGTPNGEYAPQERAAIITAVHSDTVISLCVLNPTGFFFPQNVEQGKDGGQWDWMPYQKEIYFQRKANQ